MGKIVAYHEKAADCPETGKPGILRKEWRLVPLTPQDDERLVAAFGPDWRSVRPFAEIICEVRYIRRGVAEPWRPYSLANDEVSALGDIGGDIVAVDPRLILLQEKRAEYARKQKEETEKRQRLERERREIHARRQDSKAAFIRLSKTKHGHLCSEWDDFVREARDSDRSREILRNDVEFVQLYDAVMNSVTVPKKRVAIRNALARAHKILS